MVRFAADDLAGISNQESCISFCLATLNHPAGYGLSDGDYGDRGCMDNNGDDYDGDWTGYLNFWCGRWVEVFAICRRLGQR